MNTLAHAERGDVSPSPLADTRGAILVVGLVFGFVLALAVSTLVGVGNAVLTRETLQSAADAAVFESAVWHARGMNMLATLNVLIALVLSALVFWRLATFAVALGTLLESVALLQEPARRTPEIHELSPLSKLLEEDAHVAGSALLVASALRVAETAVAAYTPVLAAHASAADTETAYGVPGETFSASLLPSARPSELTSLAACLAPEASPKEAGRSAASSGRSESGGSSGLRSHAKDKVTALLALAQSGPRLDGESARLAAPFSLPVEAGTHSLLCERATRLGRDGAQGTPDAVAGRDGVDLAAPLTDRELRALRALGIGAQGDGLLRLARALSAVSDEKAPSVFCAPEGKSLESLRASMSSFAVALSELAPDDATRARLARLAPRREQAPAHPISVDRARSVWRAWEGAVAAGASPERCIVPAQLWSPAQNGDGFLRSASVVETKSSAQGGEKLSAVAHAEAFFDCADAFSTCRPEALWQPGWAARLRRVHSLGRLLGRAEWDARGEVRRTPQRLGAFEALTREPEPVANTRTFQQLESASLDAKAPSRRSISAFIARHAQDSSVLH